MVLIEPRDRRHKSTETTTGSATDSGGRQRRCLRHTIVRHLARVHGQGGRVVGNQAAHEFDLGLVVALVEVEGEVQGREAVVVVQAEDRVGVVRQLNT